MQDEIYEHIADYLTCEKQGEIPTILQEKVQSWINTSPQNQAEFEHLKKVWTQAGQQVYPKPNIETAWQNVLSQIEIPEETNEIPFTKQRKLSWYTYAAVITFLIAATFLGVFFQTDAWFKINSQQLATIKGEQKSITLSDGTKVMLNEDSKLFYPAKFSKNERKVMLEGEAYFDVVHRSNTSFYVVAGNTATKVLGTKFNVRHYPEEKDIEVFLEEGKVQFIGKKEDVLLAPGEVVNYNQATASISKKINRQQNITAWQTGKLQFKEAPLKEVIETLSRFYRTEIVVSDTVVIACNYTGTFDKITLLEALEMLQFSAEFNFKNQDDKILIEGSLCPDN